LGPPQRRPLRMAARGGEAALSGHPLPRRRHLGADLPRPHPLLGRPRRPPAPPGGDPIMNGDRLDVVVVGGGISGLTAAFHLSRGGLRTAVLESADRVGGAVETFADGTWRFEMGPNTVLENKE